MATSQNYPSEPFEHHQRATSREVRAGWSDTANLVLRLVGMVAGAVVVIIALVAAARLSWSQGFDAPAVDVAGMGFTPTVTIVTGVLGLLALAAGAAVDRGSKLAMGAVLVCIGIAVLIVRSTGGDDLDVENGHGWLALIVGAVLILTGLAMRAGWRVREDTRTDLT